MDDIPTQTQLAGAQLELALGHLRAALIYWQTGASGREELQDLSERLAILIDESGPV